MLGERVLPESKTGSSFAENETSYYESEESESESEEIVTNIAKEEAAKENGKWLLDIQLNFPDYWLIYHSSGS